MQCSHYGGVFLFVFFCIAAVNGTIWRGWWWLLVVGHRGANAPMLILITTACNFELLFCCARFVVVTQIEFDFEFELDLCDVFLFGVVHHFASVGDLSCVIQCAIEFQCQCRFASRCVFSISTFF